MEQLLNRMRVDVNENVYLKDPFSSDLGKEIIEKSIQVMSTLGLESFTFKKLAVEVGSTEAAIYRYFENKHKLLLFLNLWYWGYLELNLVMGTANLTDPKHKLHIALQILIDGPIGKQNEFVNPVHLRQMLIEESFKAIMTKEVERDFKNGYFSSYLKIGERIAEIIYELNPTYKFPKTLASTIMESSLLQPYYAKHIPVLTEMTASGTERLEFYKELVFNVISTK
ncbi:TetR/AcrR family transcriptional regulator [Litoribacter ruber]|uniref:TetR/AcrR family transcriptional regulator n=1 Tax=Litoribacter ruber TaxID=702568 RepID=A0AAP2G344_9BACT|nr:MULTISPECIES: TetR/AcrR family transcriptional regulator [Litoribacter]MBS9523055.1 TetR/AcrR family transcriptional regulator [Litoribacter alkaliphilus]MBT0810781.1 TetR/AcrR family transcriptional regulator [Litoribacter ruber]